MSRWRDWDRAHVHPFGGSCIRIQDIVPLAGQERAVKGVANEQMLEIACSEALAVEGVRVVLASGGRLVVEQHGPGIEEHFVSAGADAEAEIGVAETNLEAPVKAADLVKHIGAHQEARSGNSCLLLAC